jgi:hypothetical protein
VWQEGGRKTEHVTMGGSYCAVGFASAFRAFRVLARTVLGTMPRRFAASAKAELDGSAWSGSESGIGKSALKLPTTRKR